MGNSNKKYSIEKRFDSNNLLEIVNEVELLVDVVNNYHKKDYDDEKWIANKQFRKIKKLILCRRYGIQKHKYQQWLAFNEDNLKHGASYSFLIDIK
jgi:hypothetical protein